MKDNSKNNSDDTQKENPLRYGTKSSKCPPQMKDLVAFEEKIIDLVHQIRLCKVKKKFPKKLNEDLKVIKLSNKTFMPAGKASNMYKSTKDEYNHPLDNAVNSAYKRAAQGIEGIINKETIKCTTH